MNKENCALKLVDEIILYRSLYVMAIFKRVTSKHDFKNFIFLKTISKKKLLMKEQYYWQSSSAENENPQTRAWKFANCTACLNSDMHLNPTQFKRLKGLTTWTCPPVYKLLLRHSLARQSHYERTQVPFAGC